MKSRAGKQLVPGKVLLTSRQIQRRVKAVAAAVSRDCAGREVLVVGVLKGSIIFLADLVRHLTVKTAIDFVWVSSYEGDSPSGRIRQVTGLHENAKGRHVLLVEDIADTGSTLDYLQRMLRSGGAASVRTCVLLDKPGKRTTPVTIDYRGFSVPDEFVVGYGLDYNEKYRALPYIAVLGPRRGKRA